MSSNTPKKKQPAKKPAAKKPAQKKAAPAKSGGAKRGRPPKQKPQVFEIDEFIDELNRLTEEAALEVADKVDDAVDKAADSVVVFANDVKTKSLRDRMLKWFKRKK